MSELQTALFILCLVGLLGYVTAWIVTHYLSNTTNGHLLQYLKRKWRGRR